MTRYGATFIKMKNNEEILQYLLSRKGQIVTIYARRGLKIRTKFPNTKIEKYSVFQARAGVIYNHLAKVIEKRAESQLPEYNAGLNGMKWERFPYILRSIKTNKLYFRFYSINNTFVPKVKYILNGQEVLRDDIEQFVLANEIKENNRECFDYPLDCIMEVK